MQYGEETWSVILYILILLKTGMIVVGFENLILLFWNCNVFLQHRRKNIKFQRLLPWQRKSKSIRIDKGYKTLKGFKKRRLEKTYMKALIGLGAILCDGIHKGNIQGNWINSTEDPRPTIPACQDITKHSFQSNPNLVIGIACKCATTVELCIKLCHVKCELMIMFGWMPLWN